MFGNARSHQPERRGSPPGGRTAQAAGRLEQPTGSGGPLGDRRGRRRAEPPSADQVTPSLQKIAQRKAVLPYLDHGETELVEQGRHGAGIITAEVADDVVPRTVPVLVRRDRQEQPAVGAQPARPLLQRRRIVFDMLEDLERAYQVEPAFAEILDRDVAHLAAAGGGEPPAGHGPGRPVRLHAQIPVALCQPDADRALAAADFEHVTDSRGQHALDQLIAQPRVRRQRRHHVQVRPGLWRPGCGFRAGHLVEGWRVYGGTPSLGELADERDHDSFRHELLLGQLARLQTQPGQFAAITGQPQQRRGQCVRIAGRN